MRRGGGVQEKSLDQTSYEEEVNLMRGAQPVTCYCAANQLIKQNQYVFKPTDQRIFLLLQASVCRVPQGCRAVGLAVDTSVC